MRGVLIGSICLGAGLVMGGACRESSTEAPQGIVDGHWQGDCHAHALGSTRISYVFQANSRVERSDTFYSATDCTSLVGQVSFSGNYHLFTRAEDYIYDIELSLSRVNAVAVDAPAAALWSAKSFCGKSDWQAEVAVDLSLASGADCPALGLVPIDYRDLVRVERQPARLIFASRLNHQIPRPTSIDPASASTFLPAGH